MGYEFELIEFSIVILGQAHNPSILNPDFLAMQEITPPKDQWPPIEVITTPAFSRVSFGNGVSIGVELEKLQVTDASRPISPMDSPVPDLTSKYVSQLPHVNYVAVGTNFRCAVKVGPHPGKYLMERYLTKGKWTQANHELEQIGLRLIYPLKQGRLVISLDPGEVSSTTAANSERYGAIILAANFHRSCEGHPSVSQVLDFIDLIGNDWREFQDITGELLS